jgi:tRNA pseudouridine55 synthase
LIEYVQRLTKTYQARIRLGARSDTDDADGVIEPMVVPQPPEQAEIGKVLPLFVGEIRQIPPAYSAAKVSGRRAYKLARSGQDFSLAEREVKIYGIDVRGYHYPWLDIEVRCGMGTYIRALARDLGERLGCGALVETLRRTQVGPFEAGSAIPLDSPPKEIPSRLLPLSAAVADLHRISLQDSEIAKLRQGQCIEWLHSMNPEENPAQGPEIAAFDQENILVAVVGHDANRKVLFPLKVLPKLDFTSYN